MKTENIVTQLSEAGFSVTATPSGKITVSIFDSTVLQQRYKQPCAEAVVLPLLAFCARHNLTMKRIGNTCTIRNKE